MDLLMDKIKGMSLSKTEKVIAEYLLANQNAIGLRTASSLAMDIGTSDTSIIRFVHRLGYSSYAEFKREMGSRLIDQYNQSLRSGNKYARTQSAVAEGNLVDEVVCHAISNLQKTCENLNQSTITKIASVLIQSRIKYVAGFRTSSACAVYMQGKLTYFLPNVFYLGRSESVALSSIVDIGREDCLLLYSFPMYSEVNQSLLELAKDRGAASILITDQVTSPLAAKADIVLPASISGLGFTNSYIAPMCLSEIILFTVSRQVDISKDGRAEQIDTYLDRHHLY